MTVTADYPGNIPILPIVSDNQQYPRSDDVNKLFREIEAIETELGVNPATISSVAAGAAPASVAEYLDMVAYDLITMTGSANWYSAYAQPLRISLAGGGAAGVIAAFATGYIGIGNQVLAATENLVQTVIPYRCVIQNARLALASAQPATGDLGVLFRRNGNNLVLISIPAGSTAGSYLLTGSDGFDYYAGDLFSIYLVNFAATDSAKIGTLVLDMKQKG